MSKRPKDDYGGLFLYEVKVEDRTGYVVANPDEVKEVLNSVRFSDKDVLKNTNTRSVHIEISRMDGGCHLQD